LPNRSPKPARRVWLWRDIERWAKENLPLKTGRPRAEGPHDDRGDARPCFVAAATALRRRQMATSRRAARLCSRVRVTGVAFFDIKHG
jgi:hypothetical protein